jgi:hypothetical protein
MACDATIQRAAGRHEAGLELTTKPPANRVGEKAALSSHSTPRSFPVSARTEMAYCIAAFSAHVGIG